MKKILWLVVACMLVTVLASAEDDSMEPLFGTRKIRYCEYETTGTATQTIIATGDWLGASRFEGYLVEWNGDMVGAFEFAPDYGVGALFGVYDRYTCEFYAIDYTWDREKNKLKDTDAIVACYDRIGDQGNFIGPLSNCKMVLVFPIPEKFKGTITCVTEGFSFVGELKGKKLGQYTPGTLPPPQPPPE